MEQPEVPNIKVRDLEAEILQGEPEDQLIGKEPEQQVLDDKQIQAMHTKALVDVATAVKLLVEQQGATRQLTMNEIKPVTPWNPEGKRDRIKLKQEVFQHGYYLNPIMMTEATIDLFNQIKPGRYFGRKIEVQRLNNGELNITWSNAKLQDRIEMYMKFPHIDDILKYCIEERKQKEAAKRRGDFSEDEAV